MGQGLENFNLLKYDLEKYPDNSLACAMQAQESDIVENELKALDVIFKNGLNVPHQDLIKSSKDYNEYKEEFTEILKSHIEMFKYEIMYPEEDFNLVKKALRWNLKAMAVRR